jgi:NADPH2 dehydrogenase
MSIFDELIVGSSKIRNRVGLAPLNTGMINNEGLPSKAFHEFHELYAKSGLGVVFVGGVAVSPAARASERSFALDSNAKAESLAQTVTAIYKNGALPILQLMHAGRQTSLSGRVVAASALPGMISPRVPDSLTKTEIKKIRDDFARSAQLAKVAGFRILEIHAAHGYLLSDFLSPSLNRRKDDYGGSAGNRFRLIEEIIADVSKASALDVGIRINGYENIEGGLRLEHLPDLVSRLQRTSLCYISISAGVYNQPDLIMPDRARGEAVYRDLGATAKLGARIPVMLAGNITRVNTMETLLESNSADVFLIGRELLANPDLIKASPNSSSNPGCTMKRLCKYQNRNLPQISCPHNRFLMARLREAINEIRKPDRDAHR